MRIGLVGYGTGGQHFHAPFIEAADNLQLAGIVARSAEKIAAIERDFPGMPIYDSLTSMIAAADIEAVTISTPPQTRRQLVLEAIAAGLHVVADKPFAPNTDVARELFSAANAKGVVLCAFHNRRFDTDVQTLKKTIEDDKLGKVWRLHSRLDFDDPASLEPGPSGGLLRDLGSHVIDQALYLLGPVTSVYAHIDEVELPQGPTNASFVLTLKHQTGATSYVSASKLNHVEIKEFVVYGSKGSYLSQMSDVQAQAIFSGQRPATNPATWGIEQPERWPILRNDNGEQRVASEQGAYFDYYNQFERAVKHGETPPVTEQQVIQVLQILDAALKSAQQNQVIEIV